MSACAILAVDLGTSGVKVALVTLRGEVLGWEVEPLALRLTPDGGAEQAPEEWWEALAGASRRVLARGLIPPREVRAVCCSTQGEGTVPVDREGRPLMGCILWMDMRGAPHLRRQFRGLINVDGAGLRRIVSWVRLTGGMPSMTGKDPAAHMLLVKEAFPEIYERTYKFLNVLDYVNYRLTGRFVATFDSILTSWVTDNRDPDRIRYHGGLLRGCGIDADKLPEVVRCTEILGTLTGAAAESLGLTTEVQVVAGSIDTTAAAVGSGAVRDFVPHLYVGTSSWIGAHVPWKKTDVLRALASVPCAVPGRYLLTALQATAGGNLEFLRDRVFGPSTGRGRGERVGEELAELNRIAASSPPGCNGVLYTPWIWGERAPVEDRTLRAGLYNVSLNNTAGDIVRSVLEGVALNTRWLLGPVEAFLGRRVGRIHLVGGGASSGLWCRIFADVLGLEALQVASPIQANARGAAFIASVGLREISFDDVPDLVGYASVYEPDAAAGAIYDERFAAFTAIYERMKPVYRRLNSRASQARRKRHGE